ncbi:unnamed protein product, partial [Timema podura]|nr:unnamed protein product [Timema podura]
FRLCVVPVRLHLQNCSDSHLVIKVTTVGNSSSSSLTNKNQLYSPHSSGCFRWVGLACSNLELSPHASESVCLSAAFGSPGTFNLGTRLEVWCRSRGAPEADSPGNVCRVCLFVGKIFWSYFHPNSNNFFNFFFFRKVPTRLIGDSSENVRVRRIGV